MSATPSSGVSTPSDSTDDRLDSWKEIATYLKRDVKTVQRWEKREGMPVHRHVHDKIGSVYAFRRELDAWTRSRSLEEPQEPAAVRRPGRWAIAAAVILVATTAFALWQFTDDRRSPEDPFAGARVTPLTDFGGNEQAATLSRDGKFVAFLSNRDGRMDVWVGVVGTGQFYNLTKGAAPELVNPSVRTLGFSPDGTHVTFWARKFQGSSASDINIWAIPVLGGAPRPYLEGVAEFDWSGDGSRLVYHTPGPGDPTFVRDAAGSAPRQIFSAAAGLHAHFPIWSPDRRFIYFVQGVVPDRMDLWRMTPDGGAPERITHHDARVSHPVFAGGHTVFYLASDSTGDGPWLYSVDVEEPQPRRVSSGLERYTSLAANADGTRFVATLAHPKSVLWRGPFDHRTTVSPGQRLSLTTTGGSSPRLGPAYLLYVSAKGESDSIWKTERDAASELWSADSTRIIGAPAISFDGNRIAFVAQRDRRSSLMIVNADGTNARTLAGSLELRGAPAWAPDGKSVTVGVLVAGAPHLFSVPLDGGSPRPLLEQHAMEPAWSPRGNLVVYSGPDIGTTFDVSSVNADGSSSAAVKLKLSRGSRHLRFTPDGKSLIVLRGEIGHKDLWLIDLDTGAERQLSRFDPEFNVRDFDIALDGRELVLEQAVEQSDIVVIELPHRGGS